MMWVTPNVWIKKESYGSRIDLIGDQKKPTIPQKSKT
jgi:hypothetical protein